jgi:hypothetical protein
MLYFFSENKFTMVMKVSRVLIIQFIFYFIHLNNSSYSNEIFVKNSDTILSLKGNVKTILEKEIIVKGERHDPI